MDEQFEAKFGHYFSDGTDAGVAPSTAKENIKGWIDVYFVPKTVLLELLVDLSSELRKDDYTAKEIIEDIREKMINQRTK
jgi:hypothetical protein